MDTTYQLYESFQLKVKTKSSKFVKSHSNTQRDLGCPLPPATFARRLRRRAVTVSAKVLFQLDAVSVIKQCYCFSEW